MGIKQSGLGIVLGVAAFAALPAYAHSPAADVTETEPQPTHVLSERDAKRLASLQGTTLQWVSWDKRGPVTAFKSADGIWRLLGEQKSGPDAGFVIDGIITEIGEDYFLFDGRITIANAPDPGRRCSQDKVWRFAVTQNRTYYRLREFEWCDGLTDYIDLYFAPSLR